MALIGACTFHPAIWSWLETVAAAPDVPDALATSTGALLTLVIVVVVVVDFAGGAAFVVGGDVEVAEVAGLVVELLEVVGVDDVDDVGWSPPTRRAVIRTKSPIRMTARSTGSRWLGLSGV